MKNEPSLKNYLEDIEECCRQLLKIDNGDQKLGWIWIDVGNEVGEIQDLLDAIYADFSHCKPRETEPGSDNATH